MADAMCYHSRMKVRATNADLVSEVVLVEGLCAE